MGQDEEEDEEEATEDEREEDARVRQRDSTTVPARAVGVTARLPRATNAMLSSTLTLLLALGGKE